MKKKGKLSTVLLIIILVAGLALLIYPSAANYWNSIHQTKAITSYVEDLSSMDKKDFDAIWKKVDAYNKNIRKRGNIFIQSPAEAVEYEKLLDISGTGIMGYIDIPCIEVSLPIYHTTKDSVLQVAAGHLEWTSLPAGGRGTHCALSGHRGLPSAKLFTNLDKIVVGDIFNLNVLDRTLTYEVDQILIVKPDESDELFIRDGKDYCTLITCTPYGINTHRILVRGHRIESNSAAGAVRVTADAVKVEPLIVAPVLALPILLVLLLALLITDRKKKRRQVKK
ncbi:MAG: class C sortase [Clostridia bacterium]|nr:class C sortase [Clostridia bacterium]